MSIINRALAQSVTAKAGKTYYSVDDSDIIMLDFHLRHPVEGWSCGTFARFKGCHVSPEMFTFVIPLKDAHVKKR